MPLTKNTETKNNNYSERNTVVVKKPLPKSEVSQKERGSSHAPNISKKEPVVKNSSPSKPMPKQPVEKPTEKKTVPVSKNNSAIVTEKIIKTSQQVGVTAKETINKTKDIAAQIKPTEEDGVKRSVAQNTVKALKENTNVEQVIGKTYRTIKKQVVKPADQKSSKKQKKEKFKRGYSQEQIPIKCIQNGIIQTTTGAYVKILEILPINYYDMSIIEQEDIARRFTTVMSTGLSYVHLKCITDKSNPARLINHIKEQCETEKYQRGIADGVVTRAQDTIDKILNLSEGSALSKRYFIIYEYEKKDFDPHVIYGDMEATKQNIVSVFASTKNTIIDYGYENATFEAGEILYYFFNRKTCREESLPERIARINSDVNNYNLATSKNLNTLDVDYISPKGLYFTNREYVYIDGSYRTYLCLKSNGHPSATVPGWIDYINTIGGDGTEVDVHIKKLNRKMIEDALSQYTRIKRVSGNQKVYNPEKREEIMTEVSNNKYILDAFKRDEDIFNVIIIITLSADTISGIRAVRNYAINHMNRIKLYVEQCYANTREFFYATMPLSELPGDIYNRNKRNYVSSSVATLYMFTSYELFDPTGSLLGINSRNNNTSLVAINPFNTNYFTNANMAIFGMPGSGKTYSTQVLAKSLRVSGNRVFFILPMKAHEYKRGCDGINGTYIQLGPGSKDRINICEIRPETQIDKNVLTDAGRVDNSLLTKKIASLLTWIQLNMLKNPMTEDETDECESVLTSLYYDFGFTSDNISVYTEDGKIRTSPIIGDMYDRFAERSSLSRVVKALQKYVGNGPCANMDGQTNVDLTNKYICFDVDESNMHKDLLPAFIFMAVDCTYSLVKQNRMCHDTIFLDEVWRLLVHPSAAEQIYDMVKIIRGYGGAVVPITQDITDYIKSKVGQTILGGTAIKLVMYLERPQCMVLANELGLTEDDIRTITSFSRGQAMLITNQGKTLIDIKSSDLEDRDYTTDPNKLRKYAIEEKHMKRASNTG